MSRSANYINRELSWLEFNQRVLDEAMDDSVPLLERLNFLTITASNLDEFFMVRVGGLILMIENGVTKTDASGMTPAEQLEKVLDRTGVMVRDQYACLLDQLFPALEAEGIRRVGRTDFTDDQRRHVEDYFNREVFPVASPQAIETEADVPLVTNLKLHMAVRLKGDSAKPRARDRFAIIPLGASLRRFVRLPSQEGYLYTPLEAIVGEFVDRYFPGQTVLEAVPFRITRNADFDFKDELSSDFLADMEQLVSRRREERCIRVETDAAASKAMRLFFQALLNVPGQNLFEAPGPICLTDFRELLSVSGFKSLRYEPWDPQPYPDLDPKVSLFDQVTRKDLLFCHPYDSYDPIVRFIQEAADDPDVLAIKQTLYRTSSSSPIVRALEQAARNGKYVTAVVELRARFDEERNIGWARALENNGVQVIYGLKRLKTHAKACIVVRREADGIARYVHFATGNYNERTARLYTDIGFLTRNETLGADASAFFNTITGYSEPQAFLKIVAAPIGLRERIVELIEAETRRSREGQKAVILAKVNALIDRKIIKALYAASEAGVQIKLNVRGICCLRPGVPGLSRNITVTSIVDRYLEHGRIFYFWDGGAEKMFIASADWMPRNLDRRVELMVPVEDRACKARLKLILDACLRDTAKARRLKPDGSYERLSSVRSKKKEFRCQEFLYLNACRRMEDARQNRKAVFEQHKPADAEKDL